MIFMKKHFAYIVGTLFCLSSLGGCFNNKSNDRNDNAKSNNESNIAGTYFYSTRNGGGVTYQLNANKTATVTVKIGDTYPVSYDGYWETNADGFVIVYSNGSGEIIDFDEMCLYLSFYDAKSKINCIKLTKL